MKHLFLPKYFSIFLLFLTFTIVAQRTEFDSIVSLPKSIVEFKNLNYLDGVEAPNIIDTVNFVSDSLLVDYSLNDYTLLSFFFLACSPCIHEIPFLNYIHSNYENCNVVLISLDGKKDMEEFRLNHDIEFDIICNGKWISDIFRIGGYPKNYLIDRNGIIVELKRGFLSKEDEHFISVLKHLDG